jgi:hypothetical protein
VLKEVRGVKYLLALDFGEYQPAEIPTAIARRVRIHSAFCLIEAVGAKIA